MTVSAAVEGVQMHRDEYLAVGIYHRWTSTNDSDYSLVEITVDEKSGRATVRFDPRYADCVPWEKP
jgi:hypothetical protein